MSIDLYLTDEQFAELPSLGPLGEVAARDLIYWRRTASGEWGQSTPCQICRKERGGWCYFFTVPKENDALAIIRAKNTAELRAALVYWTLVCHENDMESGLNGDSSAQMANKVALAIDGFEQ